MKKGKLLAAFACSLAGIAGARMASSTGAARPTPDASEAAAMLTVQQALAQGDVPALAHLYQTSADPVSRVLAAMALERIHFNLDKSSDDARICERSLIDSKPEIAFFCARFANGNLRLSSGANLANAAELDIARRFAGKLPKPQLDQLRNYVAEYPQGPDLEVIKPAHAFSIPVQRSPMNGNLPGIEVESHGKKTWLLVDTGSSVLTLDERTARDLGVDMRGRTGKATGFLSRNIPVRYGTLDKLRIGEVTLLNVPVTVTPGRQRLIGMDVLRRLGVFRLGEKAITVDEGDDEGNSCKEPMLITSNVWGTGLRVVAALSINDQLRTTLLDSGTSYYLAADQHALDQLHMHRSTRRNIRDIGPYKHVARVGQATADVDISGQPFTVPVEVFKDASLPWHYILGSASLQYMDFYFNFNTHHTCLLLHHDLH